MAKISLPHNWQPRPYQSALWRYLEQGGKRAVAIWHRRAGKDDVALHWTAVAAHQRVGSYWHMLPEASQARKAIFDSINPHSGKRRIDEAFPRELRELTRENEMFIKFKSGSTWQLVGSDNYNSLVGSPPIGIVMSEYALADPNAWSYIRPILLENAGWSVFITTPRGRNHASTMYEAAKDDPNWFAEVLTADDTGVFDPISLAIEKTEMLREYGEDDGQRRFDQEYFCSFTAGMPGSYYAKLMDDAEKDNRITRVPHEPRLPVHTAWDLGMGDSTAIIFFQLVGMECRVINYYENSGVGVDHYVTHLDKLGYKYGEHVLPHDAEVRELGTGRSRLEVLESLGLRYPRIVPVQRIEDGINAVRMMLPSMWFDQDKCVRLIDCLRNYHRSWDEKRKTYLDRPFHDWSSHAADAMRYWALSGVRNARKAEPIKYPDYGFVSVLLAVGGLLSNG